MNLYYIWTGFWVTYLVLGCLLYDDHKTVVKNMVTTKQLLNNIGLNALCTLMLTIVMDNLSLTLINSSNYILRVVIALIVGDFSFYWLHRLLHHPLFYKYHKDHHNFIVPHSFVGVYS